MSVTILHGYSTSEESSGGETIYSAQGYETAAVGDVFSDSDESEPESGLSQRDGASSPIQQDDDDEYCEANVYRVIQFFILGLRQKSPAVYKCQSLIKHNFFLAGSPIWSVCSCGLLLPICLLQATFMLAIVSKHEVLLNAVII